MNTKIIYTLEANTVEDGGKKGAQGYQKSKGNGGSDIEDDLVVHQVC